MRQRPNSRPHRVLAAVYLLLFGYVGIYLPWFPPLLAERGFGPQEIGFSLALVSISRVVLPPLWGLIADRLRSRRRILVVCALLAGAAMSLQAADWTQGSRMAWLFVHGFFLVPLFPLVDAVTLAALGPRSELYGKIRLWGSVGFIVASLGFGAIVRQGGLFLVPWGAGLSLALAGLLVIGIGGVSGAGSPAGAPAVPRTRPRRMPWSLLLPLIGAAALGQASHGPYYAFFTLQMEEQGLAPTSIGALWAWAVVAEVVLMAISPQLLQRIGLMQAFRWALALTILRWALYAASPSVSWLVAGQALHAASFGLLHVATIQLVNRLSPTGRKALGQTVLSACAYGGGIGSGLYLAGRFRVPLGDEGLYAGAAALCLAGLLVTLLLPKRVDPPAPSDADSGD